MRTSKKILTILMISLLFLFSGLPIRFGDFELTPGVTEVRALSGTIRPNGDSTPLQWTSTGATHYDEINEIVTQPTAGTTTDNVNNAATQANVDQYAMETITGVDSVSAITVWVYSICSKSNSAMSVDLYYNGGLQEVGTVTVGGSYGWTSASFTGLSLTQTNLDNLEILLTADAGGRTYTVATLYANVTYSSISISITTDGAVPFYTLPANTTQDNSPTGTNDVEIISVDTGPADLDIKTTVFSQGANTWTLGTSTGANQIVWEFSKDNSNWTTFQVANNLYVFDTNVPTSGTRNIYLRITTPTSSTSYLEYGATVTIVASAP